MHAYMELVPHFFRGKWLTDLDVVIGNRQFQNIYLLGGEGTLTTVAP